MAQQIAEFFAKITADTTGLDKGLGDAKKSLGDMERQAEKSGGAVGGLKGEIAGLINPTNLAAAAVTGLALYLVKSSKAAAESAQVDAKLAAVLKATGGAAGLTADEIDGMSTSMSRLSGVDDEMIKSGAAVLATFREIGQDVFPQAMQAALDMSAVMGQDLQSSIVQIGKALNDPISGVTALRRVGVQLNDEQQDMIEGFMESGDVMKAQGVILQELQMEFGGAAEAINAAGDGSAYLVVSLGNLSEAIGGVLLPATRKGNSALTDFVDNMTRSITDNMEFADSLEQSNGFILDQAKALQDATKGHQSYRDVQAGTYQKTMTWNEAVLKATENYRKLGQRAELENVKDDFSGLTQEVERTNLALEKTPEQLKEISDANRDFLGSVLDVSAAQEKYREGLAEADALLAAGKMNAKDHAEAVAELSGEYDKATSKIVADLLLVQLTADGAFTDDELQGYLKTLERLGLITSDAATAMRDLQIAAMTEARDLSLIGKAADDVYKGLKPLDTQFKRVAGQAAQAAVGLDAAAYSTREIAQEAARAGGPVHTLAMGLNRLPADGSEWNYNIIINTRGSVPRLPTRGTNSGPGSGYSNNAGVDAEATGGKLGKGITIVGDSPSGWSPWAEIVTPSGEVIPHDQAQKLRDMGLLDGARRAAFGLEDFVPTSERVTTATRYTKPIRLSSWDRTVSRPPLGVSSSQAGEMSADLEINSPGFAVSNELQASNQQVAQMGDAIVSSSMGQAKQLDKIAELLEKLLAKTGSPMDQAKANQWLSSKDT